MTCMKREETLTLRLSNASGGGGGRRRGDRDDREPGPAAAGSVSAVRAYGGGTRGRTRRAEDAGAAGAGLPQPFRGPGVAAGHGARHRTRLRTPARRHGRRPADRLRLRPGPRGRRRHPLVLEPGRAVALRGPRRNARAGRRGTHDDVRGRLRQGANRGGVVAVAQPRAARRWLGWRTRASRAG